MSDALYERYKEALRRGHVAAQKGREAEALDAYSEAANLAPDRALPLVAIAGVLRRLGKSTEALSTYRAALDRAPTDEAALRGTAEIAAMTGDRLGAAEALDRLALVLDGNDRLAAAADVAREALEAAESRARRDTLRAYADRLATAGDAPEVVEALARAEAVLDARVSESAEPPPPAPIDPIAALEGLTGAVDSGDVETATRLALAIAAAQRDADHAIAAMDACYLALAVAPADPGLHLALAEIYLDRGWRPLAVEKLDRLVHLATLTEDAATRTRIGALVEGRLPDETALLARCA
jgi:tetratricopeptide (TPR) repeat protein